MHCIVRITIIDFLILYYSQTFISTIREILFDAFFCLDFLLLMLTNNIDIEQNQVKSYKIVESLRSQISYSIHWKKN